MRSLQSKVIVGGLVWAIVAVLLSAFALSSVIDQIAERRYNESLLGQHRQVVIALVDSPQLRDLPARLTQPEYERVYSGMYWQIDDANGIRAASRSLFDFSLPVDPAETSGFWDSTGPNGPIRILSEKLIAAGGEELIVSVAYSLTGLEAELAKIQRNVALAFSFVALVGLTCAALLTTMLLAPLRKLRHDVVHRWDTDQALRPGDYPAEVEPLVADINELIERNQDIRDRGRRQAADLAHALKTPSAALRNELESISASSADVSSALEALDRIDAQVTHSLARARANTAAGAAYLRTDVKASISRLERLFRATPESKDHTFFVEAETASVAIDPHDFEEMLGNLLENAFKWCESTVRLTSKLDDNCVELRVEDDGPGISAVKREAVMLEGARLDTSVPGTGLGLAIVNDLSRAYRGRFNLSKSDDLGGLMCTLRLPQAGRLPVKDLV